MSKKKSVIVTAIIAVMLAVIIFASYKLFMLAFIILASILSAVGFVFSSIMFCKWLQKPSERSEDDLGIIHFKATPHYGDEPGNGYDMTYEQIKQEVEAENE